MGEAGKRGPVGLNLDPPPPGPSQACAPLYSWRTEKEPLSDPVGTCYLSTDNFTRILEYAPCRSGRARGGTSPESAFSVKPHGPLPPISLDAHCLVQRGPFSGPLSPLLPQASCSFLPDPSVWSSFPPPSPLADFSRAAGQGYCQGGFSAEFTKVRRDLGGEWLWVLDAGESGPDVDSPPSPHRLGVWSWADQGAISGKVSPSSSFPASVSRTWPLFPLPARDHHPSLLCPRPNSPLPFLRLTHPLPPPSTSFPSLNQTSEILPSQPPVPPSLPPPPPAIPSLSPSPGQILSATQEQIAESYYPGYLINPVRGQLQTRQASSIYDDSYLGEGANRVGAAGGAPQGPLSSLTPPTPPPFSYPGIPSLLPYVSCGG